MLLRSCIGLLRGATRDILERCEAKGRRMRREEGVNKWMDVFHCTDRFR